LTFSYVYPFNTSNLSERKTDYNQLLPISLDWRIYIVFNQTNILFSGMYPDFRRNNRSTAGIKKIGLD